MSDLNVEMGTMYDVNKSLYLQLPVKTKEEKDKIFSEFPLLDFLHKHEYYMLLCNEKKDYTVFHVTGKNKMTFAGYELREVIDERGALVEMTKTEDNTAYEIWIRDNNEAFVYYLFDYDWGIVEV